MHIQAATALIARWVLDAGGADNALKWETTTRSAIERQILIISEAAIRLNREDPSFCARVTPEIDWAQVRGIGNIIRHRYDDIETDVIFGVIEVHLAPLAKACERAIGVLGGRQ